MRVLFVCPGCFQSTISKNKDSGFDVKEIYPKFRAFQIRRKSHNSIRPIPLIPEMSILGTIPLGNIKPVYYLSEVFRILFLVCQ